MPIVAVNSTASKLTGHLAVEGLITNTGDVTVYLGDEPNVSANNYGIVLAPRQGVNYSPNQSLYAVTASGETSTLSVLYGSSVSVSPITEATISGPVTIDGGNVSIDGDVTIGGIETPVKVQGGGARMRSSVPTITLAPSETRFISVPLLADGQVYPSLTMRIVLVSGVLGAVEWTLAGDSSAPLCLGTLYRDESLTQEGWVSYPETVTFPNFTGPFNASGYLLRLTNLSTVNSIGVNAEVFGSSVLTPVPVTDLSEFFNWQGERIIPSDGANYFTYFPPSHTPYQIVIGRGNINANSVSSSYLQKLDGVNWVNLTRQAATVPSTAFPYSLVVGGGGMPYRLRLATSSVSGNPTGVDAMGVSMRPAT